MTDKQRCLAAAYEAIGCAMAALDRAHDALLRAGIDAHHQGRLTHARQKASLAQTDVGVRIMAEVSK